MYTPSSVSCKKDFSPPNSVASRRNTPCQVMCYIWPASNGMKHHNFHLKYTSFRSHIYTFIIKKQYVVGGCFTYSILQPLY